jgi:hypothetical protein
MKQANPSPQDMTGIPVAERRGSALARTGSSAMRYYFNIKDGTTMLDEEGMEFDNLEMLKKEALLVAPDMIKAIQHDNFWNGESWTLWVTDHPKGAGNTVLTLTFSSRFAA